MVIKLTSLKGTGILLNPESYTFYVNKDNKTVAECDFKTEECLIKVRETIEEIELKIKNGGLNGNIL